MGQLWRLPAGRPSLTRQGREMNKTTAWAGVFSQMAKGSWLRSAGLIPSHLPSNVLLCSPEKCQRRREGCRSPQGPSCFVRVIRGQEQLCPARRVDNGVRVQIPVTGKPNLSLMQVTWRRGAALMKGPSPPFRITIQGLASTVRSERRPAPPTTHFYTHPDLLPAPPCRVREFLIRT